MTRRDSSNLEEIFPPIETDEGLYYYPFRAPELGALVASEADRPKVEPVTEPDPKAALMANFNRQVILHTLRIS